MILITGGTGFIGSHLVTELIRQGKRVRVIARDKESVRKTLLTYSFYSPDNPLPDSLIEWYFCDLRNIALHHEIFDDVEYVYHCAGVVKFDGNESRQMNEINVNAVAEIVNICIEKNIKKFCYISSIAALGDFYVGDLIDENSEWHDSHNASIYSLTKYLGEMEVRRGIAEGLPCIIVQPSVVIGPSKWGESGTAFFKIISEGFNYYSEGVTAWVDVRDLVAVMQKLTESDIVNESFIVSSENLSYKDVFFYIADALKVKRPSRKVNKLIIKTALFIENIKSVFGKKNPIFTEDIAATAMKKSLYSNEKIIKTLNYSFIPVKQAIEETAKILMTDTVR